MSTLRPLARLLVPVLGVLPLAAALLVRSGTASREAGARAVLQPAIRWELGAHQAYRLETAAVMRANLPGAGLPVRTEARLSGVLELEVEDEDETGARVRFRLARPSYVTPGGPDRAEEVRLSTPFDVVFARDGRPLRFDLPPDVPAEGKVVLEQLVRTFQVVVATGSGKRWTAREENGMGRYVAGYRVADDGTVIKAKTVFEEVTAGATGFPGPLQVQLPRSEAIVRLNPGASWVETVTVEEETRVLARGELIIDSTLEASLTRIPVPTEETLEPSLDTSPARSALATAPEGVPSRSPAGSDPALLATVPADELERLLEGLESSGGASIACVHGIRDLLRAHPETAELVYAALAGGSVGDLPAAALVNSLQLAGTPEAQAALGSILEEARFGRMNRLRAAIALGGVEQPTAEALDSLWRTSALRQPGEATELADTALLALGALAPLARGTGAEPAGLVEARLVQRLAAAGNPDETGILLGALGNARNPALVPTVAPYLDDISAYVRCSAADALGNLPDPATEFLLSTRLRQETDPRVRTALASSLNRVPAPSLASLEAVHALVRQEEDDSTRLEMAKFVGEHLDTLPAARQTLRELLREDRSARVRSYVGRILLRPE